MSALAEEVSNAHHKPLGQLGEFVARLATTPDELLDAQRLRFRVFYEEMQARPNRLQARLKLDCDDHDTRCDHLMVYNAEKCLAGTQRLYLEQPAKQSPQFHSQPEFDVAALRHRHPSLTFLELGRSAILPEFRSSRTAELLWHGTWAYVVDQGVDVMVGCASFASRRFEEIAPALGVLNRHVATDDWSISPTCGKARPIADFARAATDFRQSAKILPPLIKGYLRLGAMVSSHAVLDEQFNTIDVFIILPVSRISERYIRFYGHNADRRRLT